jgi:hypothetical protein
VATHDAISGKCWENVQLVHISMNIPAKALSWMELKFTNEINDLQVFSNEAHHTFQDHLPNVQLWPFLFCISSM